MKFAGLSKLAFWLLQHQVGGYRVESLVGDLTEEYTSGRSARWLWSQVLLAITANYLRVLRLFGPRFLAAVAIGWGALFVGIKLLERAWALFQHRLGAFGASEIGDIILSLLELFMDLAAGRLVARIYRPHQKLILGAFATSILAAWDLPWLCAIATDTAHFAEGLFFTLLWTASVWLGGLWQIRTEAKSAAAS
jgi:hypothetical protein